MKDHNRMGLAFCSLHFAYRVGGYHENEVTGEFWLWNWVVGRIPAESMNCFCSGMALAWNVQLEFWDEFGLVVAVRSSNS